MVKKLLFLSLCCIAWGLTTRLGAMGCSSPKVSSSSSSNQNNLTPFRQAIRPVENITREVLDIVRNSNNNLDGDADKIKDLYRYFFSGFKCSDRTGIKLQNNEDVPLAFYQALGYVFALTLSQGNFGSCYFDNARGCSFVLFKENQQGVRFTLCFCTKKSSDKIDTDADEFYFVRVNDLGQDVAPTNQAKDVVVNIYINTDICSSKPDKSTDTKIYYNAYKAHDKTYRLSSAFALASAYNRDVNPVAFSMDYKNFNWAYFEIALRSLPVNLLHGAHEPYFTSLLNCMFRLLGNGVSEHQVYTRTGIADIHLSSGNNGAFLGFIIEAKLNGSADAALLQNETKYTDIFNEDCGLNKVGKYGILVGLNIKIGRDGKPFFEIVQKLWKPTQTSAAFSRLSAPVVPAANVLAVNNDGDEENVRRFSLGTH